MKELSKIYVLFVKHVENPFNFLISLSLCGYALL